MFDVLPDRLAWYVGGPILGLLIVGLFVVANQPLPPHTYVGEQQRLDQMRVPEGLCPGFGYGGYVLREITLEHRERLWQRMRRRQHIERAQRQQQLLRGRGRDPP